MGIDPGSRRTGVGVIEAEGSRLRCLAQTVIATADEDFPTRLKDIFEGVRDLIAAQRPDAVAVESVFLSRNPASALKLGQARGAAICACVQSGRTVVEYAPRQIKQAVVGGGGADKVQVQHMVRVLLGLREAPPADAADALAVAITHAHIGATAARLGIPARLMR